MSRKPLLLIVSQHYRPEPNFISADIAEAVTDLYDVVVVTAHPNYPAGEFYPGTRYWTISRSFENGVMIWRVPMIPDHSLSHIRRGISYLSFALTATLVTLFAVRRPRLIWVYHGPFTTMLAALLPHWIWRAPIVLTSADLWPESLEGAGLGTPGLMMRVLFAYRRWLHRRAFRIICVTRGTASTYITEGIPSERLVYAPVWLDAAERFANLSDQVEASAPQTPRIVYAGNLGPAQNLDQLIKAAAILEGINFACTIDVIGSGSAEDELRALAARLDLKNLRFLGRLPADAALGAVRTASGHYISLRMSPQFERTVPSKLYAAIAAGVPILAGLPQEATRVVREAGGAIEFDVRDEHSLADAIKKSCALTPADRAAIRQRMSRFYQENFSRDQLLQRYRCVFAESSNMGGIGQA